MCSASLSLSLSSEVSTAMLDPRENPSSDSHRKFPPLCWTQAKTLPLINVYRKQWWTRSPTHRSKETRRLYVCWMKRETMMSGFKLLLVKLCGHGTLAASHFLFTSGLVNADKIEFLTLFGVLIAKRVLESQDCVLIELDLPIVPLSDFDSVEVPSISKALSGASVIDLKITTTEEDLICVHGWMSLREGSQLRLIYGYSFCTSKRVNVNAFWQVVLPSGKAVTNLQPQFDEIKRCLGRAVIITGPAPPGSMFDFFSRVFGPKMGINEDLVTGSPHCALAGYWSKKLGKCDFAAYQASS
ncbi:Phenazine biosynthesis-like domain-containing protein [Camellia lanceoleosa]|uniref:Phenazine biosynthesis-like domain-containing protein n=1 Tax=Camellia lanceoleosa TaxID=1840588 RepID=A0ACC0F646_9ERIC|nr:Phenazine biosynthesis-like domain-containing protein [Camellia lanceoleosa]